MSQEEIDAAKDATAKENAEADPTHWLWDTDPTRVKNKTPGQDYHWTNPEISRVRGTDRGYTPVSKKEAKEREHFDVNSPLLQGSSAGPVMRGELRLERMSEERAKKRRAALTARQEKPKARAKEQMTDAIAQAFDVRPRDVEQLVEKLREGQGR